jgi:hypothetical protein
LFRYSWLRLRPSIRMKPFCPTVPNRRPAEDLLSFWRLPHVFGRRQPIGSNQHPLVSFVGELAKQVRLPLVMLGKGQSSISHGARVAHFASLNVNCVSRGPRDVLQRSMTPDRWRPRSRSWSVIRSAAPGSSEGPVALTREHRVITPHFDQAHFS